MIWMTEPGSNDEPLHDELLSLELRTQSNGLIFLIGNGLIYTNAKRKITILRQIYCFLSLKEL